MQFLSNFLLVHFFVNNFYLALFTGQLVKLKAEVISSKDVVLTDTSRLT